MQGGCAAEVVDQGQDVGEAQEPLSGFIYVCDPTCTTNGGGGTWNVLSMSVSITGSKGTFIAKKRDGTRIGAGTWTLRVGSPSGVIHGSPVTVGAGWATSPAFTENFSFYQGTYGNGKAYYLRFETTGGYAYAGPIFIDEIYL
jgi:hypothetical protein